MKDIETKEDIDQLIEIFYNKLFKDDLLAPFFADIDFAVHKPHMVHFWTFALLNEPGYKTNVTEKHMHMALGEAHFTRWLQYFSETVDELFTGEIAETSKQRAIVIGWTIQEKIRKYGKQ